MVVGRRNRAELHRQEARRRSSKRGKPDPLHSQALDDGGVRRAPFVGWCDLCRLAHADPCDRRDRDELRG